MEDFGWTRELEIVWESQEYQEKAKEKFEYVLKGRKCSKTRCHNKCKISGRCCGPSCQCVNCTNSHGRTGEWHMGLARGFWGGGF